MFDRIMKNKNILKGYAVYCCNKLCGVYMNKTEAVDVIKIIEDCPEAKTHKIKLIRFEVI